MKAFVIAADAVISEIFFINKKAYPNISSIISRGASSHYGAYAGRSVKFSYDSAQNWASIYTGLSPEQHEISYGCVRNEKRKACMGDFSSLNPFWKELNAANFSVGLWSASACREPVEINGYVASAKCTSKETPADDRVRPRIMQYCEKDSFLGECLDGSPPPRLYPLTAEEQGYRYEELLSDAELAEKAVHEYSFSEVLDNFEDELRYFFEGMKKAQRKRPVDVLWFFTPTTDLIAHFGMRGSNNKTLLSAYAILDNFIGEIKHEFQPENIVFLSDHGQWNFRDLVNSNDEQIRREALSSSDRAIWLKDGSIALQANNGALLFTAHSPTGCFAASGKDIRHCELRDMRTLDIYPTLLELFEAKIPAGREGYVMDIFNRTCVNNNSVLTQETITYKAAALIQSHSVELTNVFVSELYYNTRFIHITVVGEAKYEEIFRNNPRVFDFVPIDNYDATKFDEIYCCLYNESTKHMRHMRVK